MFLYFFSVSSFLEVGGTEARWVEEWMGSEYEETVLTVSSLAGKEGRKMVAA